MESVRTSELPGCVARHRSVIRIRVGVVALGLVLVAFGCGTSRTAESDRAEPMTTSVPSTARPGQAPGPADNRRAAEAEAKRLLALVVPPPASIRLGSAPSSLPGPIMGTTNATSQIDDSAFWRVPMSMSATLAWLKVHPPGDLTLSGSSTSSSTGAMVSANGYLYYAPSGGQIQLSVATTGATSSVLRADGIDVWIDPVAYSDDSPGPRLRVTLATACPASDGGIVGVTNPPPPLKKSMLPTASPTAGLICQYYGLNGHPFTLAASKPLSATAARGYADLIAAIPLGHIDGGSTSCPDDVGTATVAAFAYPDGTTTDVWATTSGCPTVSNGYILASGSIPPAGLSPSPSKLG